MNCKFSWETSAPDEVDARAFAMAIDAFPLTAHEEREMGADMQVACMFVLDLLLQDPAWKLTLEGVPLRKLGRLTSYARALLGPSSEQMKRWLEKGKRPYESCLPASHPAPEEAQAHTRSRRRRGGAKTEPPAAAAVPAAGAVPVAEAAPAAEAAVEAEQVPAASPAVRTTRSGRAGLRVAVPTTAKGKGKKKVTPPPVCLPPSTCLPPPTCLPAPLSIPLPTCTGPSITLALPVCLPIPPVTLPIPSAPIPPPIPTTAIQLTAPMSLPAVTVPLTVSEPPAVRVTATEVTGEEQSRDPGFVPPAEVPAATVAAEPPVSGVGVITPDGGLSAGEGSVTCRSVQGCIPIITQALPIPILQPFMFPPSTIASHAPIITTPTISLQMASQPPPIPVCEPATLPLIPPPVPISQLPPPSGRGTTLDTGSVDLLLAAAQLLMADTTAPDPGAAARARLAARGAAASRADVVPPASTTAGQGPPAAEARAGTEGATEAGELDQAEGGAGAQAEPHVEEPESPTEAGAGEGGDASGSVPPAGVEEQAGTSIGGVTPGKC
jgi:hypothetical protein